MAEIGLMNREGRVTIYSQEERYLYPRSMKLHKLKLILCVSWMG
jgi:hypothetical protein